MSPLRPVLLLALAAGVMGASDTMGPASFMWPPDRAWSAEADNTPPCGSVAGVVNRTDFPLTGGKLAFTAQDDSYQAQLSISYSNDPKSQSDFSLLTTSLIGEIDPGHTCISVPDQASNIAVGTNATIQVKYIADFDRPENQTFYACADITFVAASSINPADIPCFNATTDEDVPAPTTTGTPTNLPGHSTTPFASEVPSPEKGGLSKGAIAGAVVGSVVGFALILGLGFLFYRERERKKTLAREREAGRTVKWVPDGTSSQAGTSIAGESVRMGNLAGREQA